MFTTPRRVWKYTYKLWLSNTWRHSSWVMWKLLSFLDFGWIPKCCCHHPPLFQARMLQHSNLHYTMHRGIMVFISHLPYGQRFLLHVHWVVWSTTDIQGIQTVSKDLWMSFLKQQVLHQCCLTRSLTLWTWQSVVSWWMQGTLTC